MSSHLALRATNYSAIQDNINSAPSCAESCLDAFWERIIDVCDSDHDWPCLCSFGPAGEWTAAQQQDWVQVADSCIAADCPSENIQGVQNSRSDLSAFCSSVVNAPTSSITATRSMSTSTVSNSTTTSTTSMSSTTSVSNSTTATSTTSTGGSAVRATASATKIKNPFDTEPSSKAPTFAPSKSWLILGTLWLSLAVFTQV